MIPAIATIIVAGINSLKPGEDKPANTVTAQGNNSPAIALTVGDSSPVNVNINSSALDSRPIAPVVRPGWLPPELPPGCSNVFLTVGDHSTEFSLTSAKLLPRRRGITIDEIPEDYRRDKALFGHITEAETSNPNFRVRPFFPTQVEGQKSPVPLPFLPFVQDNRLYVAVDLPYEPDFKLVTMDYNLDSLMPRRWDRNWNSRAYEIVNKEGYPILQVVYRRANEIQINGVFPLKTNLVMICVPTNTTVLELLPFISEIPATIEKSAQLVYEMRLPQLKPIFKYPGSLNEGALAD